jgi:hypothetical protein
MGLYKICNKPVCKKFLSMSECLLIGYSSFGQVMPTKHETQSKGIKQATADWHCNVTPE